MSKLNIIHWNDVYRVTPQKISSRSSETIDVTQFAAMVDDVRSRWPDREDGKKDGLSLFSGDVFSPSVESSITRGSHMVPVMNILAPDVSLTGNHDFDFGYPHLSELIQDTTFPWLLSNIIDEQTSEVPEHLYRFQVMERAGVRIGIIGLVEKEWIGTVSSWPSNFRYKDMAEVGKELSRLLRNPTGPHKCDIIIALTHARIPNDITLAKKLLTLSPTAAKTAPLASSHGVDLILGGHDHLYYISKGVTSWNGYDTTQEVLGAEDDHGDVLVVKSGTDFRDLSEFTLELEDTPEGSIRKKVIKTMQGRRHSTKPGSKSSEKMTQILKTLLSSVSETMKVPVCITDVELDLRSQYIRTAESAAGNWFADVIRHAYDEALCMQGCGGADGVLICAGVLRSDSVYPPGNLTLGNILEILPFDDPIVVLELDGESIWDALESSLETWPAQEGRFPVISGFRVSWDSRRPAGQRVIGVWLQQETGDASGDITPRLIDSDEIKREKGGREYRIVTREYMAQGHDGFTALKGHKYLVDDESGQVMSALVRQYLLGSRFVNRMMHVPTFERITHLHSDTARVISREKKEHERHKKHKETKMVEHFKQAASLVLSPLRTRAHYKDNIHIAAREHMKSVDCYDGANARNLHKNASAGKVSGCNDSDEDLLVVHPVVDGRLKDEGRI